MPQPTTLQPFERTPMHVLRPQFRIEEERALAFAAGRGFGVIVAADERGPRASHVPFVVARRETGVIVQIHFTARNPLVELADGVRRFLLIVCRRRRLYLQRLVRLARQRLDLAL